MSYISDSWPEESFCFSVICWKVKKVLQVLYKILKMDLCISIIEACISRSSFFALFQKIKGFYRRLSAPFPNEADS